MHRAANETSAFASAPPKVVAVSHSSKGIDGQPARFFDWKTPCILLLITAIGGYFRFYHLAFPVLWNDEALVYWRACGSYGQMLGPLSTDGFPPLHYSLYWLMGTLHCTGDLAALFPWAWTPAHTLKMTPWVMRFVPAVCGTLTIPAMYFLCRQMLSKGTSLLAAAFTACSAFMLFYSRDAKMYPDLWLFVALNVGCMLWWFRTGLSTAWLCWIATGCAMVGLHASGFAIPVISVPMFLTQRAVNWKKTIWFLAGLVLIASGPVVYATKFNHWTERVEEEGWKDSGIGWVNGFFNGNRTGPDYALYTSASFLIGYEWPRDDYMAADYAQPIIPALLEPPQIAYKEVFWILAIGALPWPLMWRPKRSFDAAIEPQWRIYLWLGVWILVCAYGAYVHSVRNFESPRRWDYEVLQWLSVWGVVLAGAIVAGFLVVAVMHRTMWPLIVRFFQFLAVTAALYGICWTIFLFAWPLAMSAESSGNPWQSIWTPRYLGFIWPGVAITTAALLMRLPTRAVRIGCIVFVLAINLGMSAMRMQLSTEPPIDQLAHDVYVSQDAHSTTRTFDLINYGDIAVAGSSIGENPHLASGRYYLEMESNRPMSPDLFVNSYYKYNLRSDPDAGHVKQSIKDSPQLTRVVIWTMQWPRDPVKFDPYRSALPPGWKLAGEQVYPVRIYWDWRERWKWVRREYRLGNTLRNTAVSSAGIANHLTSAQIK